MIEQLIIHQIGLSSEIYLRLIELCKMVYVRKNGFLLRQGKVCSFIGIVKSGVLRSYISKEGEEDNSDFYFEDSFVTSYRSFLTQEKSVGSIQALEDSFIYCLDKSDYDRLLNESTEWYKLGNILQIRFLSINTARKRLC